MRTFVAFLVAPFGSSLVAAGSSYVNGSYHPLAVFVLLCGALYVLQALIGTPAYLLLGRAKRHRIWVYALLGFSAIALPFLLYSLYRGETGYALGDILYLTAHIGLLGAATGSMFWLIARPDRRAPSKAS